MEAKKAFFRFFAKLYYLNEEEKNNLSIQDFLNWKTNKKYEDFFKKVNKFKHIRKFKPYAKNDIQSKRLYELFKYTVSREHLHIIHRNK